MKLDYDGLRPKSAQKVVVKLYLRHPLHAKLYLLFRPDPVTPTVGFVGSSNLTFAGLNKRVGVLIGDVVGLGKTLMATAVRHEFLRTIIVWKH